MPLHYTTFIGWLYFDCYIHNIIWHRIDILTTIWSFSTKQLSVFGSKLPLKKKNDAMFQSKCANWRERERESKYKIMITMFTNCCLAYELSAHWVLWTLSHQLIGCSLDLMSKEVAIAHIMRRNSEVDHDAIQKCIKKGFENSELLTRVTTINGIIKFCYFP